MCVCVINDRLWMIYSEFGFAHQVPNDAVDVLGQDGAHDSGGHEVALGDFEVLCGCNSGMSVKTQTRIFGAPGLG